MQTLGQELEACGGAAAPTQAAARLRDVLAAALRHGHDELGKPRSGRDSPVEVGVAFDGQRFIAATPISSALIADPAAASDREWSLVAAAIGALVTLGDLGAAPRREDLRLQAGEARGGFLALGVPGREWEPELVELAFEEQACDLDRLRARAYALPPGILDDVALRDPFGERHPFRVAEVIARLGGRPADSHSVEAFEDAVLELLGGDAGAVRPHEDPDRALRVIRRILQRLDGMGKWGGYHTEFTHLARGFGGNDRELAHRAGDALLSAGLLLEKPSVGQRHVYLNPRRAAEIRAMIDSRHVPADLEVPQ